MHHRSAFVVVLFALALFIAAPAAADLTVMLPDVSGVPGSWVDVPITVSPSPVGQGILSIDYRLTLDPAVAFDSESKPDGFLQSWGTAFSNGTGSFLAAAAAGTTPVSSSSTLLNTARVQLKPNAVTGTNMPLTFQHLYFNEGTPGAIIVPGVLHVVSPPAGAPPPAPGGMALALASRNPARDGATFAYSVPAGPPARITIHAIDGRRVQEAALAPAAAGAWRWDLRDTRGNRVAPGVYLARLEADRSRRSIRLVVVD